MAYKWIFAKLSNMMYSLFGLINHVMNNIPSLFYCNKFTIK